MQLIPIANRIVAKPIDLTNVTASGIVLSGGSAKTSNTCEITHVGSGVTQYKVGDIVIHHNHLFFDFEGVKHLTFFEADVIGKLV